MTIKKKVNKKKKFIYRIKNSNLIGSFSSEQIEKDNNTYNNIIQYSNNKIRKNKSIQNKIINKKNDKANYNKIYYNKMNNNKLNFSHNNNEYLNPDTTQRRKISINRIKTSLLKKFELFKRIDKKDNNILVYMKGFKKHFGIEENCPLCITRIKNVQKRMKLLSSNNNKLEKYCNNNYLKNSKKNINFNDLEEEIENKEFHKFFINDLSKRKINYEDYLFNRKILFNNQINKSEREQYSMSLPKNTKIQKNSKSLFPILYDYFKT